MANAPRAAPDWPKKLLVIDVHVSCTDYGSAVESLVRAASAGKSALATALAVHGVVEASRDPTFGQQIRDFDLVAPDGQPVRIALNLLHRAGLVDRVYGPTLMLELCRRAADEGIGVYLYGSTEETVGRLAKRLRRRFPTLDLRGVEPSLFRPLTAEEDVALVRRINDSGSGLVFIGLGCPLQERFAHAHRESIRAVQICVGAAFDFHAGTKRQAPRWMQEHALEWLFRLWQEPRRLLRRYAVTNMLFMIKLTRQLLVESGAGTRPGQVEP